MKLPGYQYDISSNERHLCDLSHHSSSLYASAKSRYSLLQSAVVAKLFDGEKSIAGGIRHTSASAMKSRLLHTGAELDLLVVRGGERRAFEIKRTSSPRVTPSMRSAIEDLRLARLDVIHAGDRTFDLAPRIRAVGLSRLLDDVHPL